jgi:hypothetical protein
VDLAACLLALNNQPAANPPAAVIVFTDGGDDDTPPPPDLPFPVYTVGLGTDPATWDDTAIAALQKAGVSIVEATKVYTL